MSKYKKYVFLILAILYVGFIWSNSLKTATESSDMSMDVLEYVQEILHIDKPMPESTVFEIHHYLRKFAHFSEFAGFSIVLCLCLMAFGMKFKHFLIYVLFFGLMTAVLDEFLQIHSMGRGSSVKDVLIDFGGIIFGVFIYKTLSLYINDIFKSSRKKA